MYCHACSCAQWPCDGMFCGGFDFPPKFIDSYEICRYACSCAQRPLLRYICGVFCFRAAFPRTHDAMCAHMTQYAHMKHSAMRVATPNDPAMDIFLGALFPAQIFFFVYEICHRACRYAQWPYHGIIFLEGPIFPRKLPNIRTRNMPPYMLLRQTTLLR